MHRKHAHEPLGVPLGRRPELGVAGSREDKVDAAELRDGRIDRCLDLRFISDVRGKADAAVTDLSGHRLRLGEVEVYQSCAPSLGHHTLSRGATDAACTAGDEQDLVGEAHGGAFQERGCVEVVLLVLAGW